MAIVARTLALMETVERSYRMARERAMGLMQPLIAMAAAFALRFLFQPVIEPGSVPSFGAFGFFFLISLAVGLLSVAFIVGTHRMVLRHEERSGLDYFRFDAGTWKYIGWVVLFSLAMGAAIFITGLVSAAIGKIDIILVLLVIVAAFAVGARLSVFLPAVAIGDPAAGLSSAWAQTEGNTLRLIGGFLLVGLPLGILGVILSAIFLGSGFLGKLIGAVLVGPVHAAVLLIATIFLLLAYDQLCRGDDATIVNPEPAPGAAV